MNLQQECMALAQRFRLGHNVESALALPGLIEGALTRLPVTRHPQVARIVTAMLACQEHHDWLGLADWLEGELVSLLASEN
ncbi:MULTISPECIES: hypothetical protein [Aeromonas]|uniref:hypothetical protein n=1 Tax=Aeromonas TaxID=642 RepID=UPI0005B229EC|nr:MULTISPECIES: hypothetical protein [Aeromonas]MBS4641737.1 hypothetical protein [Aeromonas media]RQX24763.1 hypothetical protein EHZ61_08620 [Aeromonas caviae]